MANVAKNPAIGADATLTIRMGVLFLVIPFSHADLKVDGLNASNTVRGKMKEVIDFIARGTFFSSRYGKDKILDFTFTAYLVGLTGELADSTVYDAVMLTKDWAAAVSTLPPSAGDVVHATFEWQLERTNFGASNDKLAIWKYVEFSLGINESDDGDTFTITGKIKPFSTDSFTVTG